MRIWVAALVLGLSAIAVPQAVQSASPPLSVASDPCLVPQQVKTLLLFAHRVGGIEYLPDALLCRHLATRPKMPPVTRATSFEETLDRVVRSDRRYEWRAVNGVITVRPSAAWTDDRDFLNREVPGFIISDQNPGGALNVLATKLAGFPVTGMEQFRDSSPTRDMLHPFSVSLHRTTTLGVLTAIVEAHGALVWEVNYCKAYVRYEFATIALRAFDHGGMSVHTATLDATQQMVDGCRPSKTSSNDKPGTGATG